MTNDRIDPASLLFHLSAEAVAGINEIMRLGGYASPVEAIRRAIGTELLLQRRRAQGWDAILQRGHERRLLVWGAND